MKQFLLRFFTWWNGATLNTLFYTRREGELVGHDQFGNAYYRTRGGKIDPALGFERRWVFYNGISEASMTPPATLLRRPGRWSVKPRPPTTRRLRLYDESVNTL